MKNSYDLTSCGKSNFHFLQILKIQTKNTLVVLQSVENLIFPFFKVASQSNFLSPMLLTTLNASLFFPGKILFTIFWLLFCSKEKRRESGRIYEQNTI